MKTLRSIFDLIQDERLLVSQHNDLVVKCKGDIKKLTEAERCNLFNIEAGIRMRRSILRSCLSETANYGVPVLKEESDEDS